MTGFNSKRSLVCCVLNFSGLWMFLLQLLNLNVPRPNEKNEQSQREKLLELAFFA
jgi:hypothetical protein